MKASPLKLSVVALLILGALLAVALVAFRVRAKAFRQFEPYEYTTDVGPRFRANSPPTYHFLAEHPE